MAPDPTLANKSVLTIYGCNTGTLIIIFNFKSTNICLVCTILKKVFGTDLLLRHFSKTFQEQGFFNKRTRIFKAVSESAPEFQDLEPE